MSAESVETILSRAMSDAKFAESLFANPEPTLAGYDLTTEEAAAFKSIDRADVEAFEKASPEERKSFGWGANHNETALHIRN
jgi:hypothetical protein